VSGDATLGGLLGPLPKLPAGQSRVSSTSEVGGPDGRPSDVDPAGGAGEPAPGRLEQARAEIARRRAFAEGSLTVLGETLSERDAVAEPWPTAATRYPGRLASKLLTSVRRAEHILANDPAHVLQVLAAADTTLDRHARTHTCQARWLDDQQAAEHGAPTTGQYVWPQLLCADAAAVLDLYAPAVQR
jgi:hypothetical protein